MTFSGLCEHKYFRPAAGAALTVFCGLLLSTLPMGDRFMEAGYDTLFRFGARPATNKVVVVQMDDAAAGELGTERLSWDRAVHAKLLNHLTNSDCRLIVFDVHFRELKSVAPEKDEELAQAMRRHPGRVVLMAKWTELSRPGAEAEKPILPHQKFLEAATDWGIGKLDTAQAPVRRHWPFPAPVEERPSLPWTAARLAGATLNEVPEKQWLRYYGESGGLELMGYDLALEKPPEFFRGRIVFIGNKPAQSDPSSIEEDKFQTPYTIWTERAVGGVEILATEFLNLMNQDWLRRLPRWAELLTLGIVGALLGAGLSRCERFGRFAAVGAAIALALVFAMSGVCLSYYTNFLFPWLIVAGGQLPCALVWALIPAKVQPGLQPDAKTVIVAPSAPNKTIHVIPPEEQLPDAPEYEIITPAVGKGGFGKVWIARNAVGQWQALKAVYQSSFGDNRLPYETEFKGLERYKPVSERHPGLLRIDLVSRMKSEGYFYYVMELGDAQVPGWEKQPTLYKPKDLENLRKQADGRRLPVKECLRVVTVLADALDFLHQQGLTHRDIKPSNVIFVNGRPKLADIGLVADIRPIEQVHTIVGTLGYMPPPPEKPGTPQSDIYALGMLLYVISTGSDPGLFPDLSTTLMGRSGQAEFIRLNAIILKACQPDLAHRYQATSEMLGDLQIAAKEMGLN